MIDKIKNQCTSCTACSNICPKQCITLQKNEDGFNYPKMDKFKCIECSLCENICPVINKKNTNSFREIRKKKRERTHKQRMCILCIF